MARAWLRERAPVAGARLRLLVLMMGVQTVIDLTQEQISFKAHADAMSHGVIDTKDLVYFGSLVVAGLAVASAAIESRRWS